MTASSLRNVRANSVLDTTAVRTNDGDVDGTTDGSFVIIRVVGSGTFATIREGVLVRF